MMYNIDLSELNDYGKQLLDIADAVQDETMKALTNLGEYAKMLCRVELEDVRYTGALERSFVVESDRGKMTVTVYPTAAHRMFVRMGTRPHWAPIGPLKRWAAVKLGDENAAYAVQRSIAKRGTSMYQVAKRGSKDNPWPQRVVGRGDFASALTRTAEGLGKKIAAEVVT